LLSAQHKDNVFRYKVEHHLVPLKKVPVLLPNGETKFDSPNAISKLAPAMDGYMPEMVKFKGANSMYNRPTNPINKHDELPFHNSHGQQFNKHLKSDYRQYK
jgi:hypothetical protein